MKTIIALTLLSSLMYAQAPCDSLQAKTINYSTSSHTFCSAGTRPASGGWDNSTLVSGEGASSYTFNVQGVTTVTSSLTFSAQGAGVTNFTITGDVGGCTQSIAFSFTVYVCADSVYTGGNPSTGIEQYKLDHPEQASVYYNMYGEQVPFTPNTVLIERVGIYSRKIYVQQ